MTISERIFLSRKQKGFTQENLAFQLGVTKSACGQWERGTTSPSVKNLSRLAVALDVKFEWLATGRGDRDMDSTNQ